MILSQDDIRQAEDGFEAYRNIAMTTDTSDRIFEFGTMKVDMEGAKLGAKYTKDFLSALNLVISIERQSIKKVKESYKNNPEYRKQKEVILKYINFSKEYYKHYN